MSSTFCINYITDYIYIIYLFQILRFDAGVTVVVFCLICRMSPKDYYTSGRLQSYGVDCSLLPEISRSQFALHPQLERHLVLIGSTSLIAYCSSQSLGRYHFSAILL